MNHTLKLLFVFGIVSTAIANTAKAVELSLLGGVGFLSRKVTPDPSSYAPTTAKGKFVGGVGISIPVISDFSVEADFLVNSFKQDLNVLATQQVLENSGKQNMIPVIIRYQFLPELNAGLGAYLSHGTGDITNGSVVMDWHFAGLKKDDKGLVASVQFKQEILPSLNVSADLRYYLGTTNINDNVSYESVKNRQIMVLVGVGYSLF